MTDADLRDEARGVVSAAMKAATAADLPDPTALAAALEVLRFVPEPYTPRTLGESRRDVTMNSFVDLHSPIPEADGI